jgi:predicted transcriptional regulator
MNRARRGTDESLYRLYVLQEIDKGRADAKAGRTITHAKVAAGLRKKWRTDDDA